MIIESSIRAQEVLFMDVFEVLCKQSEKINWPKSYKKAKYDAHHRVEALTKAIELNELQIDEATHGDERVTFHKKGN